ncbi:MAG: helix-turn-helix domain-containing protein [bacterium]
MKKLSVTEVSKIAGKSARHIRNLCKEGKLPCQKIKISTGEKYFVYIDTEEFKELISSKDYSSEVEENTPLEGNFEETEEGNDSSSSLTWQKIIFDMTAKIESLAKEAGKTELRVDNLMSSEQNVKFYQDEYFKIRHDLANIEKEMEEVKRENTSLLKKVEELQKELENRSKPFWAKRSK